MNLGKIHPLLVPSLSSVLLGILDVYKCKVLAELIRQQNLSGTRIFQLSFNFNTLVRGWINKQHKLCEECLTYVYKISAVVMDELTLIVKGDPKREFLFMQMNGTVE